ncbi:MAG: Hsp20/alpha crystallin family protein [Thermobacillus sp.]|uniref:Molecular chaperone (Small heat shock protein) n=1 Tax=Thermobacillus composti (strain DSM 18247 / JCM 13945 / KWC4) TaxID=717605 RepID=L0EDP9_THECK|nr:MULTISPECIES: Hsp20/alpha crystallin family protein [Thermobacillus]AGA57811.1 molecular chaperone (small heat shock protein) [Thermobacillus composti KWC4]REK56747.1 MAG: Hsp20/alpha crystallin family protein [Thermobacillus sp.]
MPLIPYDPIRQIDALRRNVDRFFDDWPFAGRFLESAGYGRIDLYETENELVAQCEVPGLESREDVEISVDQQTLTISGRLKASEQVKEEQYHRRERFVGKFTRSVSLPVPVASEGISASYRNGILEIHMPKMKGDQRRRIDVQFH